MIRPILLLLVVSLTSSFSYADRGQVEKANYGNSHPDEASAGFLSGMTVGAAAGGPPGAVAGALVGALLGEGWGAKKQVNSLQVSLVNTRYELAALQEETESLRRQYEIALNQSRTNAARVIPARIESADLESCCDNTVMSVYFRSGSSSIEDHDLELITSFADLSKNLPNPLVEITGYADRNGNADANLQLSRERSQQVRELLAQLGVENSSITTVAYGESRPLHTTQSLETDFFDRRVFLRLRDASKVMLTTSEANSQ